MEKKASQLTLSLVLKDEATFDNFFAFRNAEIIAELRKMACGTGEHIIYLYGPRGHGRSHLLQAACHEASQNNLRSVYLPLKNLLSFAPEVLHGFETLNLVCVDDLQVIGGLSDWEEALFHLYNRVYDAGGRLLLAADDVPSASPIRMPDLVSRLSWGIVYELVQLTDAEKLTALIIRAKQRGILLPEEVAKYILHHYPRHMHRLFAALDMLDKASLAAQRRLTIPFVKEVLEI